MLAIISPSKTQSSETRIFPSYTLPLFQDKSRHLAAQLSQYSVEELGGLMKMSRKLAEENHQRFQDISFPLDIGKAKQAIFVFQGDVYDGIQASHYSEEDLLFCQQHLAVLSGLYGLLRPLDLMMPYRLEMGLKYTIDQGTLYDYWRDDLTAEINTLSKGMEIINLASNEYFKVLDKKKLKSTVITPFFKEQTEKGLKTVAIHAKRARGKMVNFIVSSRLTKSKQLLDFNQDGYSYSPDHSGSEEMVFIRTRS